MYCQCTYSINPSLVLVCDGYLLEDALAHVGLPLAAKALPPAVTTVRQTRRGNYSYYMYNKRTSGTLERESTLRSMGQFIFWFGHSKIEGIIS